MKNFLIALLLLVVIVSVKNLYMDKKFLEEEVTMLEFELSEKEKTVKNLEQEKLVLMDSIQVEKKKNIKKPKIKVVIPKKIESVVVIKEEQIKDTTTNNVP